MFVHFVPFLRISQRICGLKLCMFQVSTFKFGDSRYTTKEIHSSKLGLETDFTEL